MADLVQRALAIVVLIITAPLIAAMALLIRFETPGSPLYRATRVGRSGQPFSCIKLRTMCVRPGAGSGPAVTGRDDARATGIGRLLRRFRLDELPQLWNVAVGQMRLVGPRPEDPAFVDLADPLHRRVFSVIPGITGLTQLAFVHESAMLAGVDPEERYRSEILPVKVRIDAAYLDHRSPRLDLWILGRTIGAVLGYPTSIADIEARVGQLGVTLPGL